MFIKKGLEYKKEFTDICDNYNTSYFTLESVEQVNNFCSEKTEGKINKVIEEIDILTILMIINAIYFKGARVNKFKETYTRKSAFINYNKKEIPKIMKIEYIMKMIKFKLYLYHMYQIN